MCYLLPGAPTVIQILVSKRQRTFISVILSQNSTLPSHLDVSSSSPPKKSCVYLGCSWNCNGLAYCLLVFFSCLPYAIKIAKLGICYIPLIPAPERLKKSNDCESSCVRFSHAWLYVRSCLRKTEQSNNTRFHKDLQKKRRAFYVTLSKGRRWKPGRQNSLLNKKNPFTLEAG